MSAVCLQDRLARRVRVPLMADSSQKDKEDNDRRESCHVEGESGGRHVAHGTCHACHGSCGSYGTRSKEQQQLLLMECVLWTGN